MKIQKLLIILLIGLFSSANLFAQITDVRIKKKEFKVLDDGFKSAWKNVKKGNRCFADNIKGSYQMAVDLLKSASEYNAENAELNYKLGVSAAKVQNSELALSSLEAAFKLKENVASDIHFWLGYANQLNLKFDKAIEEYTIFQTTTKKRKLKKFPFDIKKLIEECNTGKTLAQKPVRVIIENCGDGINSKFPDYSPVFFQPDSILYFTSRRDDTRGKKRNMVSNEYFEDIYSSKFSNGKWQPAEHLPNSINSKRNDAVLAIDASGTELVMYRGLKKGGNIFKAKFKNDNWKSPSKAFKKMNTKKYRESGFCYNSDSTKIYYVSNRKKGQGGKDIWYIEKKTIGWSRPKNAGEAINTQYDEDCVSIGPKDSIMYFSSKGHNTIGGFDIFKSKADGNGGWGKPENLGIPINNTTDDMFFSASANQRYAYYVSNRNDGLGDKDIYSVVFLGPERKLVQDDDQLIVANVYSPEITEYKIADVMNIRTMRMTVVKGNVFNANDKNPIEATVDIFDNTTKKKFMSTKTDAKGNFQVALPAGKNYGMAVSSNGYMFHSENFDVAAEAKYVEINKNIDLKPVTAGSSIVLNNTFFDSGKSKLKQESFSELDRLASYFAIYPKMKVEISGHTDSKGALQTNNKISKDRALAVVNYLISKGVPKAKLVAVGQGPQKPVGDNKTEEGRKLNRRVEAKILEN